MPTNQLFCCMALTQTNAAGNDTAFDRFYDSFTGFAETHHEHPMFTMIDTVDVTSEYVRKTAKANGIDLSNLGDEEEEEEVEKAKYAIVVHEQVTVGRVQRDRGRTFFLVCRSDFPHGEYPARFVEVRGGEVEDGGFGERVEARVFKCKLHGWGRQKQKLKEEQKQKLKEKPKQKPKEVSMGEEKQKGLLMGEEEPGRGRRLVRDGAGM
ncbi:hypothetical protein LTR36_001230 [Oleoguttula mirabilis]|uniref:Uncharacterized protein n=1 Tax=Oleoguttula mirabilis TaxID=1507867 RepID=A0AAV9JNP4_9PEZI|nr:hypothetical protein LTR36_001230 [Oleoguttula mirabilis]